MKAVDVIPRTSPVILCFPHAGTAVPQRIWDRLNENGRLLADTDWHVDRLYDGLLPDATIVRASFHRYVIDANRNPSGESLYPGKNTTGLIPVTDFNGKPIWQDGQLPNGADISERLAAFHEPYHAALAAEVARVKSLRGKAIVYDCHSIRSHIPFLFDGRLPDFNIGTNGGISCDPAIESAAVEITRAAKGFDSVLNGRFKGGWTTRHYGQPETGVHAIQMELAQSTYLASESMPFEYDVAKAEKLRVQLRMLLEKIAASQNPTEPGRVGPGTDRGDTPRL